MGIDVLIGQAYFLRFDPKLWAARQPYAPLGALYAAACARQDGYAVALFDAIARGFGVRVCDLVGGCARTRFPAYASTGFFSGDPDRQLSHMLAEAASHPYAGAKIKIGRGIKSDVERVKQAREALGPDKLLLVDINGAYTPDVALECARAIEPYGIHWIEEPLPPGDLRGYAELRTRSPIPLAAGEAHHTVRDFKALIDGRCIDIVQPSIPGVGGLTEARRIATLFFLLIVRPPARRSGAAD